ncbi:MAG: class I SAM-dependent rRNA methyltransferase [Pirellulaceae bacterium]|nr:class I SAM-dependent rRNA methyltransferase [Pirellulaceae bacterium]
MPAPRKPPSPTNQPRSLALDASFLATVTVKSVGLHPLLYRKRIELVERDIAPGDIVRVMDTEGRHAGYGMYNPRAELALRMLCDASTLPDEGWWERKLKTAVSLRREMLRLDEVTDSYRVIHAEGDGLSGLMVDKLGDVLSAEAFSIGMYQRGEAILEMLAPLVGAKHTLLRTGPATLAQEGFDGDAIGSPELPGRVTIQECGTRFRVDFAEGHKTGFFCDQRDNRRLLASFCKDKTVLDLCCYTGGFAIQAKKLGGAAEVIGVDLDEEPLALAKENANLNQVRVKFVQADAFAYMRDMLAQPRRFDVVVLDPPKLIRSRAEYEVGYRKHFDLNKLAMQLVAPGGLLLSCTCAGLLPSEEFARMMHLCARQAGPLVSAATTDLAARHAPRGCQILYKSGAAPDHPIATNCPETEYLNAVWMRMG